jgi:hypothetical protein
VGIARPTVIPASTPAVTWFEAPQAGYPGRWIGDRTGWSTRRFVRTARRHRAIEIQVGNHTITAADPLPDEHRTAVAAITQGAH